MFGLGKNKLTQQVADLQTELTSIKNEKQIKLTDIEELSGIFGAVSTSSGVNVTPENAMRSSAVYRCVTLISGAIGGLPVDIKEKGKDSADSLTKHPLYSILHEEPNPIMSAMTYWETTVSNMLLSGNGYGLIARNRGGDAGAITWLKPTRVSPELKNGRMQYAVILDDNSYAVYDQDDMLHFTGFGWDGKQGLSAINYAGKESVGVSLAAEEYSGKFFKNGARPDGILKYPAKVNPEQADEIRNYWLRKQQGLGNAHLPAILTEGGEYQQITMSAEDSQLIESRSFQINDIARIFGVPPHMIGSMEKSTSWGTGIEQQSIGFVVYTLRPHIKRMEQEINRKLFARTNFKVKFNVSGLLRGDVKARHESYRIGRGGNQEPGYLTINEIRKSEGLPAIDGGDKLYIPLTGENNEK